MEARLGRAELGQAQTGLVALGVGGCRLWVEGPVLVVVGQALHRRPIVTMANLIEVLSQVERGAIRDVVVNHIVSGLRFLTGGVLLVSLPWRQMGSGLALLRVELREQANLAVLYRAIYFVVTLGVGEVDLTADNPLLFLQDS